MIANELAKKQNENLLQGNIPTQEQEIKESKEQNTPSGCLPASSVSTNDNSFQEREVKGEPSTHAIKKLLDDLREAEAKPILNTDFAYLFTERYQDLLETNPDTHRHILKASSFSFALENMDIVIRDGEQLVGSKTTDTCGIPVYPWYATDYLKDLLEKTGESDHFGNISITSVNKQKLSEMVSFWEKRCMQYKGDQEWKNKLPEAKLIEDGWKASLFTAPHDPIPEGRCILDFETLLNKGFRKIIQEIEEKIEKVKNPITPESKEQICFWQAAIITLKGVIKWAKRYADEARKLSQSTSDPNEQVRLLEIAIHCDQVSENPPRDFKEAMQLFWFSYLVGHMEGAFLGYSPGRFDQYMYPFFKKDIEEGVITEKEVLALLEEQRIDMTRIKYIASPKWNGLGEKNLFQNLITAGLDENGKPANNRLSELILKASINCQTTQPTISVWYHESLPESFLKETVYRVKAGGGMPAFFNYKVSIEHFQNHTSTPLPKEIIQKNLAMAGCTEETLATMSYGIVQAGFINLPKVFEIALYGGKDPKTGIEFFPGLPLPKTYAELYETFKTCLEKIIHIWQRYWNIVMKAGHRDTCDLIYSSIFTRDCINRGKSLDDGGAICNDSPTTLSSGMVNVVNSFTGVKYAIQNNLATLDDLRGILKNNWEGQEPLHQKLLKNAPKWGNDNDIADSIYVDLYNWYCKTVPTELNYLGKPYDPSMLAISTPVPFGKACNATPDGRYAGEPIADGVTSPTPGTDTHGPLSVLLSAKKLDHAKIRGGLHNMKFPPSALAGEKGENNFLALLKTYFAVPKRGLFDSIGTFFHIKTKEHPKAAQIQVDVVDSRLLNYIIKCTKEDADYLKKHPEYAHMQLRVSGFSGELGSLSLDTLAQIANRTEQLTI